MVRYKKMMRLVGIHFFFPCGAETKQGLGKGRKECLFSDHYYRLITMRKISSNLDGNLYIRLNFIMQYIL